jgi:predicted MFS family arabinose efflux permease
MAADPASVLRQPHRVVANGVSLLFTAAFFSYLFLLTLFEQQVLHYSPLQSGLGYLPLGFGIGAGMGIGTALMPRVGVKPLMALSFLGAAGGLLLTSQINVDSSYLRGVLPGITVLAMFCGLSFAPTMNAALHQVTGQDSSLASGVQNTMQQIGAALGLACLVTLALRQVESQVRHGVPANLAAAHGYAVSFRIAAALLTIGGLIVLLAPEHVNTQLRNPLAETEPPSMPTHALAAPEGA